MSTKPTTLQQEINKNGQNEELVEAEILDVHEKGTDKKESNSSPLKIDLDENSIITTKLPGGETQRVTTCGPAQINLESSRMTSDTTITQESTSKLPAVQQAEEPHINLEIKDSNIIFE